MNNDNITKSVLESLQECVRSLGINWTTSHGQKYMKSWIAIVTWQKTCVNLQSVRYLLVTYRWWRHQTETFFPLLALCEGNIPVAGGFPSQRPVTRNFDVFLDLRLNKRLNKQSRPRWFETPSHSLWRNCNGARILYQYISYAVLISLLRNAYISIFLTPLTTYSILSSYPTA